MKIFTKIKLIIISFCFISLSIFADNCKISGSIFNDINKDGVYKVADDSLISGVTVKLYDEFNILIDTFLSATSSFYSFDIDPNIKYRVRIEKAADFQTGSLSGLVFTSINSGLDDNIDSDGHPFVSGKAYVESGLIRTVCGEDSLISEDLIYLGQKNVDFGFYESNEIPVVIGNVIWLDFNKDGLQDENEPLVSGVTVSLIDSNGMIIDSVLTDANGEYYFHSLDGVVPSGSFQVVLNNPSDYLLGGPLHNYALTKKDAGANALDSDAMIVAGFPSISLIAPSAGGFNYTYDFGFILLKDAQIKLDGAANVLFQKLRAAAKKRIKAKKMKCVKAFSKKKAKKLTKQALLSYEKIWELTWMNLSNSADEALSCNLKDSEVIKAEISLHLNKLAKINKKIFKSCSGKKAKKLKKNISSMVEEALGLLDESIPAKVVVCE